MNKINKQIIERLNKAYPLAKPALNYETAFELLVAVILSAQCTDKRVNQVTEILFKTANTPEKLLQLGQENLEKIIFPCGLYKSKAKHLISASESIIKNFNGQVPCGFESLKSLSGVGQKTANVVSSVWFKQDAIAVDTHVFRLSNRIGIAISKTPYECEEKLKKAISKNWWSKAHHLLIYHGRQVCKARKPDCDNCVIKDLCKKVKNV